jgi:hypothetical protein
MKRILLLGAGLCALMTGFAQDDPKQKPDTIKVGGMTIIREKGKNDRADIEDKNDDDKREYHLPRRSSKRGAITTNWIIPDLGFSNYNDQTNYSSIAIQDPQNGIAPGSNEDWFKLRPVSSVNFNIWLFMQRISLAKRVVNFKYGLGIEYNSYRLEDKTVIVDKTPFAVYRDPALSSLKKNKLGASYITMPFMLNFNFTPKRKQPYGFSTGVSVGYLYRAYQKTKEGNDKNKTKGLDFDTWKIAYVGEVSLGIIHLYGSYAMESLFTKDQLNMTPYTVGFRFSNW